jgi:DNA-binding NtrC family response regulator
LCGREYLVEGVASKPVVPSPLDTLAKLCWSVILESITTLKHTPISILAVDDDAGFLELLKPLLRNEGYSVEIAEDGLGAVNILQNVAFDLVLLDIEMPKMTGVEVLAYVREQDLDTEVVMLTGVEDLKTAVKCMKAGAFHYITKPYSPDELLSVIERAVERKQLRNQNKAFGTELARRALPSHIVSHNKNLLHLLDVALRAAPTDSSVLIQGASGTGKDVIAGFIHANSLRKDKPFLALNCASIPVTLIESELFGHERGAFTDAKSSKQGLAEMAHCGTLFLDEIAEMPLSVQPKLLRFLQTGEFRRVGGNKNMRADVRIISATNADLREKMSTGQFREDLFYRLNVIMISLPPLQERKEDIPLLVEHFLAKNAGTKQPKKVDERAMAALMKYSWPGNVRELENVLERAVILSHDDLITLEDIALPGKAASTVESQASSSTHRIVAGSAIPLVEMQRAHVEGVLNSVNWNKELAAKILGISIKTLYAKIQAYNLIEPR